MVEQTASFGHIYAENAITWNPSAGMAFYLTVQEGVTHLNLENSSTQAD